ncbi:MAG: zinc transporter [Desulforhopalus sp.]|jgi:zinc transporter
MEANGLIHAFILDGNGGGQKVGWDEIDQWSPDQGKLWIHLNYTSEGAAHWLELKSGLESLIVDALLSEETRPRSTVIGRGILLTLRGINHNPGEDAEDMVSLRIWAEENIIITTRKRQLLSVTQLGVQISKGCGPTSPCDFIVRVSDLLTSYIEDAVDHLENTTSELEERVNFSHEGSLRTKLSALRRSTILLRRYLAPQREAIVRMQLENVSWFTEKDKRHLYEGANSLIRIVEDLDSLRDRASVAREELTNALSAQLNSRMYVLSIITAIFLPLSFFTGLLGINVGGIPGANSRWAFLIVIILLLGVCTCQYFFFRKRKWI